MSLDITKPTVVYLVYFCYGLAHIFATRELAEAYVEQDSLVYLPRSPRIRECYQVHEWKVEYGE